MNAQIEVTFFGALAVNAVTPLVVVYTNIEEHSRIQLSSISVSGKLDTTVKEKSTSFTFGVEKYVKGYTEHTLVDIWGNSYPDVPYLYGNV